MITDHRRNSPPPIGSIKRSRNSSSIAAPPTTKPRSKVGSCATFTTGQRTAIVHVAFCPPFAGVPQVEAESLDGPACDIRPTLVLPWGVRWECKLTDPATINMSVVLEFFAAEGPAESTAGQR